MPDEDPKPRKFRLFKNHEVTVSTDIAQEWDNVKSHFQRNKTTYVAVGVAGITFLVMREAPKHIGSGVTGTAGSSVTGTRENVMDIRALSFFSNYKPTISAVLESGRQGPPSWVVRCKETNEVFTSQHAASLAKGISETNLSKHLNNLQDHAGGLHFERICMAA